MPKNLVIVESPAKAKTIKGYLGADFDVKSSFGHIRDLPKKGLSVDKDNNFEPTYEISSDKKKLVSELKKAAKDAATVWLASDEDREGEAIAWHLSEALKLDQKKTKRIVFHEITKSAILGAIENPRQVDKHLVDAQQARRVLDRLVGYELSPVLWKKVQVGLSAGRVQSVAVRLIVDREREIRNFTSQSTYKVSAEFEAKGKALNAKLKEPFANQDAARKFLNDLAASSFSVADVQKKEGTRSPGAPFTTSTLQQEAARKLGYGVKQTMQLAQRLYESGHITYMRTDSVNLSGQAIAAAKAYIEKEFGANYSQVRSFTNKNKSAQEAHEAIRPTDFNNTSAGDDERQQKLYRLIWQRTVSGQMANAKVTKTEVQIKSSSRDELFICEGEILKFDGFLKVGGTSDDVILPELQKGESVTALKIVAGETLSRASGRYSEATLVRKLEELGIGRPSTYAPTISTIQDRGYIEKKDIEGEERQVTVLTLSDGKIEETSEIQRYGADRNKLAPTPVAEITNDFLVKYFGPIVDFDFTANAEKEFDDIADGKVAWNKMIKEFYTRDFHPLIEKSADVSRSETSQMRHLGDDPKTREKIFARLGRFGPMLQKGETSDDKKPVFAPLPEGVTLDSVTLEQALEMFKLPRKVGATDDGQEIVANIGRFGPYIKVGKLFVSIKPHDPATIDLETAKKLYSDKLAAEAEKTVADFGNGIRVLNGRYGPYITDGKKNARIPKEQDPKTLTEVDCKKLLDAAPTKARRAFRRKTK